MRLTPAVRSGRRSASIATSRAFAGRGQRSERNFKARGQDVSYVLPVAFLDAANGATRTITLPEGKTLQVTVPEGAEDRQMLRLKEQGMPGYGGGPPGDAYVELHIQPHPFFHRKDDNIHVEVPVTLKEAMLGGRIEVPTIGQPVKVTVPKGSNSGTTLRLRERGIRNRKNGQRGHQLIILKVVLPTTEEPELVAFLETGNLENSRILARRWWDDGYRRSPGGHLLAATRGS